MINVKLFAKSLAILFVTLASTEGQTLSINNFMKLDLNCAVQEGSSANNFKINTKSLLKLIANDQGFTLPDDAKLWLMGDSFAIVNAHNTIFTNISTDVLNVAYVTDIFNSKLNQTQKIYNNTIKGTQVVTLNYNGSSTSFTLSCYGKYYFHNESNGRNAFVRSSFSSEGFGPGTSNGHNMIVTGSVDGDYFLRYTISNPPPTGSFPPGETNVLGTFPH